MKRLLLFIPLLTAIMLFALCDARCAPRRDNGINFYDRSWQEVLQKARTEHKLIFLDVYASWCGPCKMLRRQTFTDREVGDFYNSNFVNASFDGEKDDGVMLARKFRVEGYPALFILDGDGNILSSTMGYQSPRELIKFGRQAMKR